MVSQHPLPDPDRMTQRLTPDPGTPGTAPFSQAMTVRPGPGNASLVNLAPPPWRIEIPAADGTVLLVLREEDGRLVVEGDESRWTEGAKKFLFAMMQWAGGAGINWKNEVRAAGGRG